MTSKSQERHIMWKNLLIPQKQITQISANIVLDLPNQRVIHNDVIRTRPNETRHIRDWLEKLLTLYCKDNNFAYKQGLNEVLAPFILLSEMQIEEIYACFTAFVQKFLPCIHRDQKLTPEIYATPWLLTLLASKLDLELLYCFWDLYMIEDDPYLIMFILIASLIKYKNNLAQTEISQLPQILSAITLQDQQDIVSLIDSAKKIKQQTPKSFLQSFIQCQFNKEELQTHLQHLENQFCIEFSPQELLENIHPDIQCSQCEQFKSNSINKSQSYCVCQNFNILVLDCRDPIKIKHCRFPNLNELPENSFSDMNTMAQIANYHLQIQSKIHICLLSNCMTLFQNSELLDNSQEGQQESKDSSQQMIENLLIDFTQKGFQYISIVNGGFQACHDLAMSLQIQILDHQDNCYFCIIKKKSSQKASVFQQGIKMLSGRFTQLKESLKNKGSVQKKPRPNSMNEQNSTVSTSLNEWEIVQRWSQQQLNEWKNKYECLYNNQPQIAVIGNEFVLLDAKNIAGDCYAITLNKIWKDLIKITSKRENGFVLTFYFGKVEKEQTIKLKMKAEAQAKECVQNVKIEYTNIVKKKQNS